MSGLKIDTNYSRIVFMKFKEITIVFRKNG